MKWVVTSAWPYVNTVPHLGNMVGSVLSADVFARYLRMRGHEVVFVSGSDEHGTVIEVEAIRKGIHPKQLTDQAHEYIVKLWREWGISFDNYSRTESPVHKDFVRSLMMKIYSNGYMESRSQIVPYCPRDGIYLPDRFIRGICPYCGAPDARGDQCDRCGRLLDPQDLVSPQCVFCGSRPVFKARRHWFFRLDKLESKILNWVLNNECLDENVRNFTVSWIKSGLSPRSVTRDNKWGIKAPFPGANDKTIYVWFDALLGYVSATIEFFMRRGEGERWKEFWMNPDARTSFFIGKDNIPFHSVILPAMLLASNDSYVLPTIISATEYLMFEGQKFSKRRRVGVWIDEALKIVSEADYWRYALIRMRPEDRDTNFKWVEFIRITNSELNDHIGNFIHRVLTLIWKHFKGRIPEVTRLDPLDREFNESIDRSWESYTAYMNRARLRAASDVVVKLAEKGNKYLNRKAPWARVKESVDEAGTALGLCFKASLYIAVMLYPIMPRLALRVLRMMNVEVREAPLIIKQPTELIKEGHRISRPSPPFKKLSRGLIKLLSSEEELAEFINKVREEVVKERPEFLRP